MMPSKLLALAAILCFVAGILLGSFPAAAANPHRSATASASAPAPEPYDATDTDALLAAAKRGPEVIITGTVKAITVAKSGKVATLTFQDVTRDDALTAAIFPATLEQLKKTFGGENGSDLAGKKIHLKGALTLYKDAPQIVIKNVAQIAIVK